MLAVAKKGRSGSRDAYLPFGLGWAPGGHFTARGPASAFGELVAPVSTVQAGGELDVIVAVA